MPDRSAAAPDARPAADGIAAGAEAPLRLEEFLPYRLNVLASLVSLALSRIYAERYRLAIPEWRIVATLGQYGTLTAKQVGAHSRMHKTKVSRAAANLQKRRLVVRRENPDDRREAFLTLTAAGRAIYQDLAPVALDFAARLVADISPKDRATFATVLAALTARSQAVVGEVEGEIPHEDAP